MFRPTMMAVALIGLSACGGPAPADTDAAATAAKPATSRQKTVFDDQLKALDKAKAVEKQLKEAQEKRDKEEAEAEGG